MQGVNSSDSAAELVAGESSCPFCGQVLWVDVEEQGGEWFHVFVCFDCRTKVFNRQES
jgi:hypothetical protein